MAQTIEYNIKVNDQGAIRTIQQMEAELQDLNAEIKDVDVNSDVFKKASKNIQAVTKELEDANLALKGLTDEDKIRGFQGAIDVVGGSVAGLTGAIGLLGIENEEFEKYTAYAANAIAFSEGIRTAAQGLVDLRAATKAAGGAQAAFNAIVAANPIGLFVAALAALTAGLVEIQQYLTPIVSRMETLKNLFLSAGDPARYMALQMRSMADAMVAIDEANIDDGLKDQIAVMQAFGQETINLEIQLAERKVAALKEGEEGYRDALRELSVLRAKRANDLGIKQAEAERKGYEDTLKRLQDKWAIEGEANKLDEEWWKEEGDIAARAFFDAFKKTADEFNINDIEWIDDEDDLFDEEMFGENGAITKIRDGLQKAIDDTVGNKANFDSFLNVANSAFDNITSLSQQRYDREIINLQRERSEVENNVNLSEQQRLASLQAIEAKEIEAEKRRIKAENDQFTLKQTLLLAETVMNAQFYAMEQIQIAKLNVAKATATAQEIALAGTAATAKASMSIGAFVAALGPFGIAAFAVSIGGIIASIISAKRKAKAQIAALGGASGGGGDAIQASIPSTPAAITAPRDTGVNPEGVASQQTVRAYVVAGDVSSSQEANAKLNAKRTLG